MFRNYFKVALRYLLRHRVYTAINILGLAIGITCCVLIMLFVRSEWSYDKFHGKSNRIFRTWQHEKVDGQDFINTVTPLAMGPTIRASFPEVENECRVYAFKPILKVNENSFPDDVRMVDSTFFQMFDFELMKGDQKNPFPASNSMLLTTEMARKYFGKEDPMGKNVEMQLGDEKIPFTVSGVVKNCPENSSIQYKLLIPYSNAKYLFRPSLFTSWTNVFTETYVLIRENARASDLEKKFPVMLKQVLGEDYRDGAFMVHLQPMTNIHLNIDVPSGNEPVSNPKYSYILATIGILLLLLACVNFITLSVGRSTTRALEVGVRKAIGAERKQLIRQFWGESFLLTIISVIIGLGMTVLLLAPFNQLISRDLSLELDIVFWSFCLVLIALIAIISGIYPAIVLSRFNPVEVLKGKIRMKGHAGWLRQSLIVGQFVISIAMIVCTLTINRQMSYLRSKDLGYNKEQVVVVETHKGRKDGLPLAQLYRTELLKYPEVKDAAVSVYSLAQSGWINVGFVDEKRVYRNFRYNAIDPHFFRTMGFKMAQGREFDPDNTADAKSSAIVNEAFVAYFGMTDPVGKKLPGRFEQQIVGVVKDFNFQSLHEKVEPLLMTISADSVLRKANDLNFNAPPQPRISVRLNAGDLAASIKTLNKAWKAIAPNQDFDFQFLDQAIAAQYNAEQHTNSVASIASILSIFIACMGLFGLATLTVTRRTKEIGIRKVMGANVGSVVALIAKDFLKLVAIAAIIAFPLAWWFLDDWLKDFAYKVNIGWVVFIAATVIALLIALITISFQAIRAAIANPAKSLRTE